MFRGKEFLSALLTKYYSSSLFQDHVRNKNSGRPTGVSTSKEQHSSPCPVICSEHTVQNSKSTLVVYDGQRREQASTDLQCTVGSIQVNKFKSFLVRFICFTRTASHFGSKLSIVVVPSIHSSIFLGYPSHLHNALPSTVCHASHYCCLRVADFEVAGKARNIRRKLCRPCFCRQPISRRKRVSSIVALVVADGECMRISPIVQRRLRGTSTRKRGWDRRRHSISIYEYLLSFPFATGRRQVTRG